LAFELPGTVKSNEFKQESQFDASCGPVRSRVGLVERGAGSLADGRSRSNRKLSAVSYQLSAVSYQPG
jgi:hypothetical protein